MVIGNGHLIDKTKGNERRPFQDVLNHTQDRCVSYNSKMLPSNERHFYTLADMSHEHCYVL